MKKIDLGPISITGNEGRAYKFGPFQVFCVHEPCGVGWHISISHKNRAPAWHEMRDIKYALLPDVSMYIAFPLQSEYVNVHEHCYHLWQLHVEAMRAGPEDMKQSKESL